VSRRVGRSCRAFGDGIIPFDVFVSSEYCVSVVAARERSTTSTSRRDDAWRCQGHRIGAAGSARRSFMG